MVNEWRASSLKTSPYIPPYFIQATLILSFPISLRCRLLPIITMLLLAKEIHHFLHAALHFYIEGRENCCIVAEVSGIFSHKRQGRGHFPNGTTFLLRVHSMSDKFIIYNNIEDPDDLLAADENKFSSTDLVSYFFDSIK